VELLSHQREVERRPAPQRAVAGSCRDLQKLPASVAARTLKKINAGSDTALAG